MNNYHAHALASAHCFQYLLCRVDAEQLIQRGVILAYVQVRRLFGKYGWALCRLDSLVQIEIFGLRNIQIQHNPSYVQGEL